MYAQEDKSLLDREVTHSFIGLTLADVLKALESEIDGLIFVYSPSSFDMERRISARFEKEVLRNVLETIFREGYIDYQQRNDKIILRSKSPGERRADASSRKLSEQKTVLNKAEEEASIQAISEKIQKDSSEIKLPTVAVGELVNAEKAEGFITINKASETILPAASKPDSVTVGQAIPQPILVKKTPKVASHIAFPSLRLGAHNATFYGGSRVKVDSTPFKTRIYQKALAKYNRFQIKQAEEKKFRAYLSSYTGYTQIGEDDGIQMGGSLVWLKNKRWGFGFSGYAIQATEIDDQILSGGYRTAGGYGGFLIEYTLKPSNRLHFSFPLTIGAGGIAYVQHPIRNGDRLIEDQKFIMAIEQGAAIELNVIKYIRVGFELNYRFTSNTNLNYQNNRGEILASDALNGLNFGIRVKLGLF